MAILLRRNVASFSVLTNKDIHLGVLVDRKDKQKGIVKKQKQRYYSLSIEMAYLTQQVLQFWG